MEDDWRIGSQANWLTGVTLRRRVYRAPSATWDHDHCDFCWAKFSETLPDALREGFNTEDGRHWICDQCFADFRERFGWIVIAEEPNSG